MTEYIKREDALKAMEWKWAGKAAFDAVKAIPPADVVEIKKEGEWEMFDLISSAWYGKGMYFKQDNGTVYSRHSGGYMTVDEAISEFISLIDEDAICVPSVTTVWGDGEAPTYVLQKKGKWEFVNCVPYHDSEGNFIDEEIEEQCSLCGRHVTRYALQLQDNFCPNCGADMRHPDD